VTGSNAELRWTDPEAILAAGIEPWTDLTIWLPPGELHDTLHQGDVAKAIGTGLRCRPIADTVADTWYWPQGLRGPTPQRPDRRPVGLDPEREMKSWSTPADSMPSMSAQMSATRRASSLR
jgi:2'-hydroxyisoflavone reductase